MSDLNAVFRGYEGSHCTACGYTNFPPSGVCPSCLAQDLEVRPLSRKGRLYSFSSLRVGEDTAFVGYVDLPENVRVFGRIDGGQIAARPVCDMPVRLQSVQASGTGPRFVFMRDDKERVDG